MDDDVEHADVQDDGRLMLLRMVYTENLRANTGLTSGILDSVIFGLLRTASAVHVRRTRLLCRQRMHSKSFCAKTRPHCNQCRCRQKVGTHLKSDNLVPA